MTDESKSKAIGRKSIRASLQPRDLMEETPDLARAWTAQVVTLLPEAFPGILGESLMGKALKDGVWQLRTHDLRRYGEGKHRNVDDTPAGGGAGMVLRADVVAKALTEAKRHARGVTPILYLSPRGKRMDQAMMQGLAKTDGVILLCGRFEGVDERVLDAFGVQEVSLGDFVMTGGEIAAQALIDATVRLLPGVLGNAESAVEESFSNGLLEHPQYTKPADWEGRAIPEVLLSGNHAKIAAWRREMSEKITKERRPDLWAKMKPLSPEIAAIKDGPAFVTFARSVFGVPPGRDAAEFPRAQYILEAMLACIADNTQSGRTFDLPENPWTAAAYLLQCGEDYD